MQRITIIGFGRFGKTLYKLLKDDFQITLYNRHTIDRISNEIAKNTKIASDLATAYKNNTIFYAIPIAAFEEIIKTHRKYFRPQHILIDVLSVKIHPAKIFTKYVTGRTQALLMHPMFGPDSSKNGFEGLPIILDQFKTSQKIYTTWKKYFLKKGLRVIEMSAAEHDEKAAHSQGLTHFIGRLLQEYGLKETSIDSLGTMKLLELKDQTCNDTWQLFTDMQNYNLFTQTMRNEFKKAYENLCNKMQLKKPKKRTITIGIQGGHGSFNEEAIMYYIQRNNIKKYKISYLYTSENVLRALQTDEIDLGLFAIHNSAGGVVFETLNAMGKYPFTIVEDFAIKISHTLIMRSDARFQDITSIMTHPQVLAQCKMTLLKKYPALIQTSGENELIDHAKVAEQLSKQKLPKHIATMGSALLAKIYKLKIIEENLQDMQENYTSFLLIKKTTV